MLPQGKGCLSGDRVEYFTDQACSFIMAEDWPLSVFAFLLTSTSSRSIKARKKILAGLILFRGK